MSDPDTSAVRALYDAWNEDGVLAVSALLHPAVTWYELADAPGSGTRVGRAAVERYLVSLVETAGKFTCTVESTEIVGSEVLAALRLRDSVTPSGVPVDFRVVHVHRFRDGAVNRVRPFADSGVALAAGA